ncbi:MAG: LysM peptidoglycan-binding domain-containing protein [Planctomycetaceae bacterium]|jgi:nucleoid-associated protein YgaU|nr:LysM peptidoglycan-binding domain-containing protein [Planctomycetaceae bacterium]
MSNKNRFTDSDKSDHKKTETKPLPLPTRNEISTHGNLNMTSNPSTNNTDNSDSSKGLTALIDDISTDKDDTAETNQKKNLIQNLTNIVTKIWSPIHSRNKPIFAQIIKMPAFAKRLLLQLFKLIASYCIINVNEEFDEKDKTANANTIDNVDDQKQSQSKNLPNQNVNKSTTEKINIVTKNPADTSTISPTISPARDLYGEDNDIYEGFSWQNIIIKSAVVIVALLLLVAGYIGIRPILHPNSPDEIAQTDDNNNTQTPEKENSNFNETDNKNQTREPAPVIASPESSLANNAAKSPNNIAPEPISNEIKNENTNNTTTPQEPNPPLPITNIFAETSPPATDTTDQASNTQENIPPVTQPSPDINPSTDAFATLPPANPVPQPIPPLDNSLPFNSPFGDTSSALLTDNSANSLPTTLPDLPVLDDNKLSATKIDQPDQLDIAANNFENKNAQVDDKPVDNSPEKTDTANTAANINSTNNPNMEMVPLAFNNDPIAATNNFPDSPPLPTTDSADSAFNNAALNTGDAAVLPKKQDEKDSELTKVTSAAMESLQIKESKPDVLTDANSVPRVPSQEHALTPTQNEPDTTTAATVTADENKQEPSISVTKNDPSFAIVPDNNVQPRFTTATPSVPEKDDAALSAIPDIGAMRQLQPIVTEEITPTIPTAEPALTSIENFSPTTPFNAEPNLKIPTESAPSLPSENKPNTINVAQNEQDKTPAAAPINLSANQPNKDNTTLSTLSFANIPPANTTPVNPVENAPEDTVPLAVPVNADDAKANVLLGLLPSSDGKVENVQGNVPNEFTALQDNAPAVPAESRQGYRRSPLTRDPAAIQVQDSNNVLPLNNASVYRDQLDNAITKSPEYAELYTVKSGDTYMSICDRCYGTGLLYRALAVHNRTHHGAAWIPVEGTQIEIPTADYLKTNYANILAKNNRYTPKNNNPITPENLTANTTTKQNNIIATAKPAATSYTVRQGDSVFKIAQEQLKDTTRWREIIQSNSDKLQSARDLKPGMEIILPTTTASGYKRLN